MSKSFSIQLSSLAVSPQGQRSINMDFDADADDILSHFTLQEVIEYFGQEEVLHEIGKQAAIEYFDLEEEA